MTEDTQSNLWTALIIVVLMALGALCWAILKRVKNAVLTAIQNVRTKSTRPEKPSAK